MALAHDALYVISKALANIRKKKPGLFKDTIQGGKVYNNGKIGIECSDDPVKPWEHGDEILKEMKKVTIGCDMKLLSCSGNIVLYWASVYSMCSRLNLTHNKLYIMFKLNIKFGLVKATMNAILKYVQ